MLHWFRRRQQTEPQEVWFRQALELRETHCVELTVRKPICLTEVEQFALRDQEIGVKYWWLRHKRFGFAILDLPRGDQPFTKRLLLPPGDYTLGVGRGDAKRRMHFAIGGESKVSFPP